MEEQKLQVMTSFGPVPFDAVKEHLPKEIVEAIESLEQSIIDAGPEARGLSYYLDKVAERRGCSPHRANAWLGNLENIYPAAALSLMLREIALDLDMKYPDHISKSKELYVVSMLDGRIHKVKDKNHIRSYKNFAAFRTIEDAKYACSLLSEHLRMMFKSNARSK